MKNNCTRCGIAINKSVIDNAYLCRMCERSMNEDEMYAYLDLQ